jgi:hypothetical protein
MTSLLASVLIPFLSASMVSSETRHAMSFIERVNDGFLEKALTFAAVFVVIQLAINYALFKRSVHKTKDASQ